MFMHVSDTKDIIKKTMSLENQNTTGGEYVNLYKRFEKIAAAFYLVTNHLSDADPLKKDIREKTVILLNLGSNLLTKSYITSVMSKDKIEAQCTQLISLLSMAAQAGLMTTTNVQIIEAEIKKTLTIFDEFVRKGSVHEALGDGSHSGGPSLMDNIKDNKGYVQNKKTFGLSGRNHAVSHIGQTNPVSKTMNGYQLNADGEHLKPRKKNRRDFILSVISQKGEVTIKDISSVFKGCSEKTIQRELLALVDDGVITKEGERRWSRYKLAGNKS